MAIAPNRPADPRRRPGREHLASAVLALMLAFVVWLSAISRARPIDTLSLPAAGSEERISVEFIDLPEGYSYFEPSQRSVKVTLRGVESEIEAMVPADLIASLSLAAADPGDARFEGAVHARCREPLDCLRRGLRVSSVRPERLTVRIGPTVSQTLPVEIEVDQEPPPGHTLLLRRARPAEVLLVGAEGLMERAVHASVSVLGLDRMTRPSLLEAQPVVVTDAFGRILEDIRVEPSSVDVELNIVQRDEPVYVFAQTTGSPAEGYRVVGIDVEPERVLLSGPREAVEPLKEGLTPQVDVGGITEDLIARVPLDLPEGVRAVDAADGVTVTVRVTPLQGTRSIDLPVQVENAPEAYELTISPARVRVLVGGPQPLLDALEDSEIEAWLDLAGITAGSRRVAPMLRLPEGIREIRVTPAEIDVTASRVGSSSP